MIGIVVSQCCHRQDLPGFYMHHHTECAVLHIVFGNSLLHPFFQASLHGHIQGQHNAVALAGCYVVFIGKGHIHFVIALGGDHAALTAL